MPTRQIIIIPSSVELVGVSTHVLNLARFLNEKNLLSAVVCPAEGWLSERLRQEGLPYHVIYISYKPLDFLRSNFTLFQFLRKKKTLCVVHLHGRFPCFVSLLSMVMLKQLRFVVTVHQFCGTAIAGFLGWKNRLEVFIWKYLIDRICCVSEDLKKETINRLGGRGLSKLFVIRNWIHPVDCYDTVKAETWTYKKEGYLKIVALGRLSLEKGFDILIDAIRILTEKGLMVQCDIFGEGPERMNLVEQSSRYGLNANISLKGTVDSVRYLLPKYDFLVIPSRMESFGIVVLEAYDARLPVIASNIPGLREIVQSGKTGLFFNSGDNAAESLSGQIIKIVNSPTLYSFLVKNGKKFVKNFYPNNKLVDQYRSFYSIEYENN